MCVPFYLKSCVADTLRPIIPTIQIEMAYKITELLFCDIFLSNSLKSEYIKSMATTLTIHTN